MPSLDVRIIRHGDDAPWSDIEYAKMTTAELASAVVLEGGMASGAPSVAFRFTTHDGQEVIAQTSLAIVAALVVTARGAFPEAFAGGPLAADAT